jgi:hypothetical protein
MSTSVTSTGITFPDATTQSTAAGAASIPSGSVTNFYQSAAPTGWTQVTTMNDYSMRIVSGTGGTTGGTTAFSTVFANQTPTITTSGLSAGATTLSTTQMPSHSHIMGYTFLSCNPPQVIRAPDYWCGQNLGSRATEGTGGGGSHTHTIAGSATSSAITLNVLYQNHILCSKN